MVIITEQANVSFCMAGCVYPTPFWTRLIHSRQVEGYARQLKKKYGINEVNISLGASVILKAAEMIEKDIDSFFDYTVSRIKDVIDEKINTTV